MEPSEHSMGTFIERSGKVLCYGGSYIEIKLTIVSRTGLSFSDSYDT